MQNNDWKILAVIPARGGSKGLPGKNIRNFNEKPLIAWSIEAALQAKNIHNIAVSSDDSAILETAKKWGCKTLIERPSALAADEVTVEPVIFHVLDNLPETYTHVLLLQPTSPLRTAVDIDAIIELAKSVTDAPVISVSEPSKSPFISLSLDSEGVLTPLLPQHWRQRRQELPKVYVPNGALYISCINRLKESETFMMPDVHAYLMPVERSVDIDTELDFLFAEFLLTRRNK